MREEIEIGEMILVKKEKDYHKGDIITYQDKDNFYYITHRIINKKENYYITKGDNNNIEDREPVQKEQIQGKVIFHSKILGKILRKKYIIILTGISYILINKKIKGVYHE